MNQGTLVFNWRTQHKPKGIAYSMFYEGDTIYSFGRHWPLARRVELADSKRVVFLTNEVYYSSRTAGHLSLVRRSIGWSNGQAVEHDLFHTVTDEASLTRAAYTTHERLLDRQYEAKVAARERANRDRAANGDQARSDLESMLGVDLDEMSGSAAVKLRNLLAGVPSNNFMSCSYRRSGMRHGGFAYELPELVKVITAAIEDDPSTVKRPGFLLTLIENFKLLAA